MSPRNSFTFTFVLISLIIDLIMTLSECRNIVAFLRWFLIFELFNKFLLLHSFNELLGLHCFYLNTLKLQYLANISGD